MGLDIGWVVHGIPSKARNREYPTDSASTCRFTRTATLAGTIHAFAALCLIHGNTLHSVRHHEGHHHRYRIPSPIPILIPIPLTLPPQAHPASSVEPRQSTSTPRATPSSPSPSPDPTPPTPPSPHTRNSTCSTLRQRGISSARRAKSM